MAECSADHSYFVAEVVAVEAEGKAFVLAMCTRCADFVVREAQVSSMRSPIRLLKQENKNKE